MKKPKRINSVSVSLFLIAILGAYAGWAGIRMFWPVFQLKGIMRSACDEAYRRQENDKVMKYLLTESRRTGMRLTKDNFRFQRIPWDPNELDLAVKDSNSPQFARRMLEQRGRTCVIDFLYKTEHALPLFDYRFPWTHRATVEKSLETHKY